jgi:hypothetical protein
MADAISLLMLFADGMCNLFCSRKVWVKNLVLLFNCSNFDVCMEVVFFKEIQLNNYIQL